EEGDEAGGGGGGGHGAPAAEPAEALHQIEDLVVNPAGSGGTRFLVAAVSLDADPEAQEELTARDSEARDLLLTVLASRTVEQLSEVSHREVLRTELKDVLNGMLGHEGVHRVFFPQFVIQ
ncbi:MAG: flagellar basal body-associated FliL family protein, partial [Longimicrobiales bacterium]